MTFQLKALKKPRLIDLIKLDEYSITAKYLQIVNSVIREIENGNISRGDYMPSINELSFELDIARDTVEKGYRHLKRLGIIAAIPRRGFYIKGTEFRQELKIFLLFNKLSAHKKTIYDSFVTALGENAAIDFYIYNNNAHLFKKLISHTKGNYSHYVIIPHVIEGAENAYDIINEVPKDKLVLLDKMVPGITGEYAAAYENFERDIYLALIEARGQLSKYHTLKIIFPDNSYYPCEIIKGFRTFCQDHGFTHGVVKNIEEEPIKEGMAFINVMEDDLVRLIERIMKLDLTIGRQVGIISYNETPLKKFILDGITTISTDFGKMGMTAAELILNNSKDRVEIPFKLTLRSSL